MMVFQKGLSLLVLFSAVSPLLADPPQVLRFGPEEILVNEHKTYTMKVAASGKALAYRWWHQEPDSAQGHAIPYGEGFAPDKKRLSVPNALPNRDYNGWYWCVITATKTGESTTSPRAHVTVIVPPRITRQPSNRSTRAGGTATFSVQADAGAPIPMTYRWYFNDRAIAGAFDSTLSLNNVQLNQGGFYSCRIKSQGGTTQSGGALLSVTQ
jgi:hypothetical protein